MRISLGHLLAVRGFVSNGSVVAVSQSYVWPYKADGNLSPCCMASLHARPFHHLANKLHNLGAALDANAERVQPIRVFRVISCQNGSVKVFPALLPVVYDRPNRRLIFSSSSLNRCRLLRCRWSGLCRREDSYSQQS